MFVQKFISMPHILLYNTLRFDKSMLHARFLYLFQGYILIIDWIDIVLRVLDGETILTFHTTLYTKHESHIVWS